jgi:hypothetical protein
LVIVTGICVVNTWVVVSGGTVEKITDPLVAVGLLCGSTGVDDGVALVLELGLGLVLFVVLVGGGSILVYPAAEQYPE